MKYRMVTITVEEQVIRWARSEASRLRISVSRLLVAILKERISEEVGYEKAMRRALARKPFLQSKGSYLSREVAHQRTHRF